MVLPNKIKMDKFCQNLQYSQISATLGQATGFPFHIAGRGGNGPPTYGGGLSPEGGGMAREFIATN